MMKVELLRIFLGWDLDVFRPGLILHDACVIALVCVQVCVLASSLPSVPPWFCGILMSSEAWLVTLYTWTVW